ncbi:FRG domain-containing protein [Halovivax limisalsi]|uniref:FRG domain-containing protein n=1 Tax=Halovivax limisalsi TaxID=1453760 RepID=UPI001FFD4C03|nr:FRG domain-containing protein [Halovivax limisalsi]
MSRDPDEFVADDWATLQQLLYRDSWNEELGRHRSPYVFRGVSDSGRGLRTSLQRFVGDSERWDLEHHLLRNFRQYARQEIDRPESPFHLMALAQHHGLPTRLLDWTHSPAVAAYFAAGGPPDADGVVWAVDYERVHERLPERFRTFLDEHGADLFSAAMLNDLLSLVIDRDSRADRGTDRTADVELDIGERQSLPTVELKAVLAAFSEGTDDHVVFFQPPSIDQRIVNQAALFSAASNPRTSLDAWFDEHPDLAWKIVVPAARKREFRDKLDQSNINHRTLFPDLDGIATWLTEYYRPR